MVPPRPLRPSSALSSSQATAVLLEEVESAGDSGRTQSTARARIPVVRAESGRRLSRRDVLAVRVGGVAVATRVLVDGGQHELFMCACGSWSGASTAKPVLLMKSAKVRVTGGGMKGWESGGPVHSCPELTDAVDEGLAAADTTGMSAVKVLTLRAVVSMFLAMSVYSVTAEIRHSPSSSQKEQAEMSAIMSGLRTTRNNAERVEQ
ncbi:hypothetical protein CYMTET_46580 [Cymbomonas tetramitiformis]|uniref:Uncharacterized protein n=1 Tax=Cymbomonas tetramitiformis TaxID=36881 RepID=A0AAE0BXG0_9CHLO|nr:hypothetical protein CYMTET_46580 [Cymbomonas tetramitiformis]